MSSQSFLEGMMESPPGHGSSIFTKKHVNHSFDGEKEKKGSFLGVLQILMHADPGKLCHNICDVLSHGSCSSYYSLTTAV